MKFWIASYPRSGNTFFRIVMEKVYGIRSIPYNINKNKFLFTKFRHLIFNPGVKTHLLPSQLENDLYKAPVIYIVRDGRDSLVSMAHQRKNILSKDSDYYDNLREAIIAAEGSFFGGWSNHVKAWENNWSYLIKFEDLINNPIECIEKLRPLINLKPPKYDKLPSFLDLKNNTDRRLSISVKLSLRDNKDYRRNFFRRGKVDAWKDEMPEELQYLFWKHHGDTMDAMGYAKSNK